MRTSPGRIRWWSVCSFLFGLSPIAAAQDIPDGWFIWPSVEPVSGSALDTSELNSAPAGGKGRVMVQDGHFVTAGGERIRFWGCNLTADVAFPPIDEIDALARRLAKGGVNIARLHHLDNSWGVASGGSLWSQKRADHEQIDPAQLDRLHRLIAALKAHGIYSNLNLKVSKVLGPADGFPESVTQLPLFQKRADIFQRRMIELQKSYARQLLTTKNPYTGLAPVDDPAVALIEITNENSLLGFWTRDLGRGLDKFPEPFRGQLTEQWNAWLTKRYVDDAALMAAWGTDRTATTSALPAGGAWATNANHGAELTLTPGADVTSLELHVARTTGTDWHAQVVLRNLALVDGAVYTVACSARADQARSLGLGVGLDTHARPTDGWRSFGLLDTVRIGTDWTEVRLVFPAHSVGGAPAALSLNAGQTAGTIWLKELSLNQGNDAAGLHAGQSLHDRTVPIPTAPGKQQWADWIHFLADTERAFADEMRHFLKDELGVQAPIIGSQIEYGGLAGLWREQEMDFADSHSYWQHPDFAAGAEWSSSRWSIGNSPQLAVLGERSFGEYGGAALLRVAGKPFAMSEYDHPAPSEFACEMYPTLASFACRQDWDALYPFDLGTSGSRNPDGAIGRYFDQLNHPAKWGFGPFAARVFRGELIAPAPVVAELQLGSPLWGEQPHGDILWRNLIPEGSLDFLNVRYGVSDHPRAAGAAARIERRGSPGPAPITLFAAPLGPVYVVNDAPVAAAVGFLGGATVDAGALHVTCARFGRDFAAVTAVALDRGSLRESGRVLITVVARAQNQGIKWNAERTSVGTDWGHGPPIVERVPATITLGGSAGRTVYALAPDGSRAQEIKTVEKDGELTFAVGPDDHTLHYEIVGQ